MIKTQLAMSVGGSGIWTGDTVQIGSSSKNLTQLIKSIFATGEQGFAYDPNDLSTMFQDAAGTIPVTAAGQPVGLMLDKGKGLVLGTEIIANGSFSGTAGWSGINGSDEVVSDGFLNFINPAVGNPNVSQAGIIQPSKSYRISFRVANYVAGAVYLQAYATNALNNVMSAQISANGVYTAYLHAPADATGLLGIRVAEGSNLSITDVSVKELLGNHAYQSVSASRPVLQRNAATGAYYLAFDGVDDFLQTNNIDFTATDKVSLFASVRKLSDATQGMLIELSAAWSTNAGSFVVLAPSYSGGAAYSVAARLSVADTANQQSVVTGYSSPVSSLITALISTDTKVRIDGVLKATNTSNKGTGTYGNHPLYIGRRGGASIPFTGHLYSLIGIGRLTTDSETIALEKAIAKNVGVTL